VSDLNGNKPISNPSGATSEVRAKISTGAGRVMLVDDDPIVRDVTQRILKAYGFDVIVCSCGEESVALYRTLAGAVDLVLVDMCMPGMDGYDTFKALRALRSDAVVVLFSGAADAARVQAGLDRGAAAFLAKPFTPEALVTLISRVLSEAQDEPPVSPRARAR
jgi:CheY-like chemotaxis protein